MKRGRTNASAPTRATGRGGAPSPHDLLLQRRLVALVDFFPVDYAPPGLQVFGTTVVVFEIVCMLPVIVAEDGKEALRDGVVLVGSGYDFHFAFCVGCRPDPSSAEPSYSVGLEIFLEGIEVAKSLLYHVGGI